MPASAEFQAAAARSIEWYENVATKMHLHPVAFACDYMCRTGRVTLNDLRKRDPDLVALWAPVQIDEDLRESSVHRRELGVRGDLRQRPDWQELALELGLLRLEELDFVVLRQETDATRLFPVGLVREHSNVVVGAAVVAKHGLKARVLVAIDGAGEVFSRTGDSVFEPGHKRRYPPRPLTEREARAVEEALERQYAESLRRMEERSDG